MMGNHIKFGEKLGQGGYGSVYLASDEYNNVLATKKIPSDKDGIPCLMEASIMATINHPYINKALKIQATNKELYIFQHRADNDIVNHIRRYDIPSNDQLRLWCFQLMQAVACLEKEHLIHGDVKGNNVLYYEKKKIVKLTDFSFIRRNNWSHPREIGTSTHRSLEVWLQRDWDETVDIWGLGCTFYEMATGHLLIPIQEEGETSQGRRQYINALLDWAEWTSQPLPVQKKDVAYQSIRLDQIQAGFESRGSQFADLLLSMLRILPGRPKATTLMYHPYFTGLNPEGYFKWTVRHYTPPSKKVVAGWKSILSKYCSSELVINQAIEIMSRAILPLSNPEGDLLLGCYWIASKMVTGKPPLQYQLPEYQILSLELAICLILEFKLYYG